MSQSVVAVSYSPQHTFSKPNVSSIRLIAGRGVEGDAHCGELVKHRYLVQRDDSQPNLRQVHLIHQELLALVAEQGYEVAAGELGENVTTRGIDLLTLPTGTVLRIGSEAVIELTGLRNPCVQIDEFRDGLMKLLRYRDTDGSIIRLGGVMAVVLIGGVVRPDDRITVELPPEPQRPVPPSSPGQQIFDVACFRQVFPALKNCDVDGARAERPASPVGPISPPRARGISPITASVPRPRTIAAGHSRQQTGIPR